MPRRSVPSYRLHKPSDQARTIVRGKHIYLGKYNSPESRRKYARLLAEMSQPTTQDIAAGPNSRSLLLALPTATKPREMYGANGPMVPGWKLEAVMPKLEEKVSIYLDERDKDNDGKPFFLYMPLTAPHTPIAPTKRFLGMSQAGRYGDFVYEVDWTVGQVVAALERNNLADNTLLIFTSDNGSPQRDGEGMNGEIGSVKRYGHDPSRPWRGLKADIWEAGHRVPFVVRWPGHVKPNTESDEPLVLTDILRTVAQIVGHQLPADAGEDSFDMLPVLRGEFRTKFVRDHMIHHSGDGTFAIR